MSGFKSIAFDKLKIKVPFGLKILNEFSISKTFNEHTKICILGILSELEFQDQIVEKLSAFEKIEVYITGENGTSIVLFNGIIENLEMKVVNKVTYVKIHGISNTFKLDIKKRYRSFQNKDMTYAEIFNTVLSEYPLSDFIDEVTYGCTTGRFILQYNETDWEFLVRLASHFNSCLVADSISEGPKFYLGIPAGKNYSHVGNSYSIASNLADFTLSKDNYAQELNEIDLVEFILESEKFHEIGSTVNINSRIFKIKSYYGTVINGILMFRYTLRPQKGIRSNPKLNYHLTGASIEGEVIDVKKEFVKVHLFIDKEQSIADACWFHYASMYHSCGNTGWYCMPKIGDQVKLYFPSQREEHALVTLSVRTYGEKLNNNATPSQKYFKTDKNKQMLLDDKNISFTANSGENIRITLDEENGIEVHSSKVIVLKADNDFIISTPNNISFEAEKGVYISCQHSSIIMDGETHLKGSNIKMEGKNKNPAII